MGEVAELMLDGTLCEGCGVAMDDGDTPGYPRKCSSCAAEIGRSKRRGKRKSKARGRKTREADRGGQR